MADTFKGYPNFNSTRDPKLRAWNRCAIFYNIVKDRDKADATRYLNQFNDIDKAHIRNLTREIQERGYTTVRREIVPSKVVH